MLHEEACSAGARGHIVKSRPAGYSSLRTRGMDDLWRRVRARKLVQWSAAYVAAAWLALQALDLLGDHFGWPGIVFRAGFVLLCAGLVLTLILAWYHGEQGRQRVSGPELIILATLLGLTAVGLTALRPAAPAGSGANDAASASSVDVAERASLAVLPFTNIGRDSTQEYFSDGLSEELIALLGQVPGLRVIPRSSSFYFKGKDLPADSVGRRLRVGAVLEGSVRLSGGRARVTVQLVGVQSGSTVWTRIYDRQITDILSLEESLAREIAGALSPDLGSVHGPRASSAAALDHYMRARYLARAPTAATLTAAVDEYRAATALDPGYAAAWAGLANAYQTMAWWNLEPPSKVFPVADSCIRRSLALDSTSAYAFAVLGQMERWWRHDRAAAERALLRAIRLDPRQPEPHGAYAWFLLDANRAADAVREGQRAYELDPFSVGNSLAFGEMLIDAGDLAAAARQVEITLALDPNYGLAWYDKGWLLIAQGRPAEAATLVSAHLSPGDDWGEAVLGEALARSGRAAEARALARRMEERARHEWVQPMTIADIYGALGDTSRALDWLEEAERRGALEPQLDAEPEFRALHGEPRYQRLLRSLGLP